MAASRRKLRLAMGLLGVVVLTQATGALADPWQQLTSPDAEGCTNLDAEPITYIIEYQSAIQGIFNKHCIECHEGKDPPAGLDLSAGGSWHQLVNVPSSQDDFYIRVVPNQPLDSLLFLKVNCDVPGVGSRMPFGADPLSDADQALIHDWIAGGAPATVTDGLFRNGFDSR